ncbi:MAG: ABC transporter permease [Betaproteobacteria bacterium]|nr:ABC transporter permease [Betaproteobacteria bacterium]
MAQLAIDDRPDGQRIIALTGRLDATTLPALWQPARDAVARAPSGPIVVDAAGVEYCDGAGVALFVDLLRSPRGASVEVRNLQPASAVLLRQFDPQVFDHDLDPELPRGRVLEEIGRAAATTWRDVRTQVEFIGETAAAMAYAATHPRSVRWKEVWHICERVGVDALPIVALISFLMGMILAFQSAVPMKRFGAEIFVADLIGLAMLRELGPLLTAILLAGRSGAAFAAEIGTMRVNQEVDALTTMGLDPVRFLVTPRIIAAVLMTPLLTLFADSFSIPFVTFLKEVDGAVNLDDFLAGFVKSFVFAVLVAGIGCLRGLQTRAGASAVGESATRAVVSGIILLVVIDGVFALVYYLLDV